jgi:hypothetical protein
MDNNIIQIWYAHDESGPAELIGDKLARISDMPLLTDEVWVDDIVRVTHLPEQKAGRPHIAEVVVQRFPSRAIVRIHYEEQAYVLSAVFALLTAECVLLFPPKDGKPGMLRVAYNPPLDPIGLAKAIGIDQDPGHDDSRPDNTGPAPESVDRAAANPQPPGGDKPAGRKRKRRK